MPAWKSAFLVERQALSEEEAAEGTWACSGESEQQQKSHKVWVDFLREEEPAIHWSG